MEISAADYDIISGQDKAYVIKNILLRAKTFYFQIPNIWNYNYTVKLAIGF